VAADAHEVGVLRSAVDWAAMHAVESLTDAAQHVERGRLSGVLLAGEGAPWVAEDCVDEFGAALGMSPAAGRGLVGDAMELRYRLPNLWREVMAGRVTVWRARRVAGMSHGLTREAARFVDEQVHAFAHRVGVAQLDRLVEVARARLMPEVVAAEADRAADGRRVRVFADQVSFAGTVEVAAELDLADALDFDKAISVTAAQLGLLGSGDSLDVRRAVAVGELARRQLTLDFTGAAEGDVITTQPSRAKHARQVVLYVHLAEDALKTRGGVARVENTRSPIGVEQVRAWCGASHTQVVVKPVIDLAEHVRVDHYEIPARVMEQVALRDGSCVFPWCTRPARSCRVEEHGCDGDHVVPHGRGGPTCGCNLAPLCRRHHRLKTHGAWRYLVLEPGSYLWTSPHGYQFLRDHTGSRDVTGEKRFKRGNSAPDPDPPEV
jgi:hypothetical protein